MASKIYTDGSLPSFTIGNSKEDRFLAAIDESRLAAASRRLTKNDLAALYESFTRFDHMENGRISREEVIESIRRVGDSAKDVVPGLIDLQGESDKEELNFEDFVNLMTNDELCVGLAGKLHPPREHDNRHVKLNNVLSRFVSRNNLGETLSKDSVGYCSEKQKRGSAKRFSLRAAHVIREYSNSTRSLGLTEKEVFDQMESIKKLRRNEQDDKKKNSPYAAATYLNLSPIETPKTNQRRRKQPGWRPAQGVPYAVKLPTITIKEPKTFERNQNIRTKVKNVKANYHRCLSKAQERNYGAIWKNLHVDNISSIKLRYLMKEIYGTYTTSKPSDCRDEYGKNSRLPPVAVTNSTRADT